LGKTKTAATEDAFNTLAISKGSRNVAKERHDDEDLKNDQEVEREQTHTTRSLLDEGGLITIFCFCKNK